MSIILLLILIVLFLAFLPNIISALAVLLLLVGGLIIAISIWVREVLVALFRRRSK